ncbi:hypothetical protein [Solemya velesiana gill symbiont]|nr:hypothetical protein [Solemya velesiana gill symbiont]
MTNIVSILGDESESLLSHNCKGISKDQLQLPGSDFIDRVTAHSDRKAFQRPMAEGVALLNAIQDAYLSQEITVA